VTGGFSSARDEFCDVFETSWVKLALPKKSVGAVSDRDYGAPAHYVLRWCVIGVGDASPTGDFLDKAGQAALPFFSLRLPSSATSLRRSFLTVGVLQPTIAAIAVSVFLRGPMSSLRIRRYCSSVTCLRPPRFGLLPVSAAAFAALGFA
jgi:hypothetical protein